MTLGSRQARRAAGRRGALARALFIGFLGLSLLGPGAGRAGEDRRGTARTESAVLAEKALEWFHRGEASTDKRVRVEAFRTGLRLAEQAVALDASLAEGHFAVFCNLGRLMEAQGAVRSVLKLGRLRAELDRTLALDPTYRDALFAKGVMKLSLPWILGGSLDEAERYLRRTLAVDPGHTYARLALAKVRLEQGRPERARAELARLRPQSLNDDERRRYEELAREAGLR